MTFICIVLTVVYLCSYALTSHKELERFVDFKTYYHAAKGNFSWKPECPETLPGWAGWLYADWTAHIWKPLTIFSEKAASHIWLCVNLIAYSVLMYYVGGLPYGWIFILASVKLFAIPIWAGNISPVLAALCLSPVGCAVACMFKPYLVVLLIVHAFRPEIVGWLAENSGSGHMGLWMAAALPLGFTGFKVDTSFLYLCLRY